MTGRGALAVTLRGVFLSVKYEIGELAGAAPFRREVQEDA
jgi:hypothetical protein